MPATSTAADAWKILEADPRAQLVDVRTMAEWNFVGLPDLSGLARRVLTVEWQSYPGMGVNPDFAGQVTELHRAGEGAGKDSTVLFLCRSGARSRAAAIAMTKAGFSKPTTYPAASRAIPMPSTIAATAMAGKHRTCPGVRDDEGQSFRRPEFSRDGRNSHGEQTGMSGDRSPQRR